MATSLAALRVEGLPMFAIGRVGDETKTHSLLILFLFQSHLQYFVYFGQKEMFFSAYSVPSLSSVCLFSAKMRALHSLYLFQVR
jgi:hypothetical protein